MKPTIRSVLVVDDSTQILDRLTSLLCENNADLILRTAATFSKAMEILGREQFDIVLLDIHLPDGTGIELLKLIGKKYPSTRSVMISNQAGEYYQALCKRLGAVHFIDKSKDFELLPELIEKMA
jgi:DNA-binding NtrC family response regulator